MNNKASLFYENNTLTADHIDFNSKMNILKAEGTPMLEESDQEMYGYEMGYDMGGGGIVVDGSTQYNKGYYQGKHIFKDGDDILKVYDSIYTTCDLKKPHYSLRANKMKVYIGDKVVLEVTQIGKECHTACAIRRKVGKCVMPEEGIFTRVIQEGVVKPGDRIRV